MRRLLIADLRERLAGPFTEWLSKFRRVDALQPYSDLLLSSNHDEGIAIHYANDRTVERLGVRRVCDDK